MKLEQLGNGVVGSNEKIEWQFKNDNGSNYTSETVALFKAEKPVPNAKNANAMPVN